MDNALDLVPNATVTNIATSTSISVCSLNLVFRHCIAAFPVFHHGLEFGGDQDYNYALNYEYDMPVMMPAVPLEDDEEVKLDDGDGGDGAGSQMPTRVRHNFVETWLWMDVTTGYNLPR